MKWTNVFKLPQPLVELVTEDLYNEERQAQLLAYCTKEGLDFSKVKHFSASDLIKPPRMRVLTRRYWDEIISDVSLHIYRVLGTAVHTALRLSSKRMTARGQFGYIAEERLFTHFGIGDKEVVVISGEPDLITPDGVLHDYKVTGIFGLNKGVKIEWEQATNIYAWLRHLHGLETKGISITYILRDWKSSESMQAEYPPAPAQILPVTQWSIEEAQQFVNQRLAVHLEADRLPDDRLPECSGYGLGINEMWEKPEMWAVIRKGGKRSAKNWKMEDFPAGTDRTIVETAANADMEIRNKVKPKKGENPYIVEHRPGERTRCLKFCDARNFCSQFKEYAGAAFKEDAEG